MYLNVQQQVALKVLLAYVKDATLNEGKSLKSMSSFSRLSLWGQVAAVEGQG